MGMVVVGLGLLDLSIWYYILNAVYAGLPEAERIAEMTSAMLTFGMGASRSGLLFARVPAAGFSTKALAGRRRGPRRQGGSGDPGGRSAQPCRHRG